MRKYIGNITIYNSMKVESDPAREKLRLKLLEIDKKRNIKRHVDKHLDEIEGRRELSESIEWLFNDEGKLPANISAESIKAKYKILSGQLKWVKALVKEMHKKLEIIDPLQANVDKEERELLEQKYEAEIDENNKHAIDPGVCLEIHKALRMKSRAAWLKKSWEREISDTRIVGICRVETAMRYLFADYIAKPELKITDDLNARYQVIKKEADWLSVMIIDLEGKLINLREMVYASEELL
jgi:hypothetical protein